MDTPVIKVDYLPSKIKRGEKITLKITLEIAEGIHIQAHKPAEELLIPTIITLKETEGVTFGKPVYPEPEKLPTSWSKVELLVYEGKVDIQMPIQVVKNARLGKHDVEGTISFQGCTASLCLPPMKQEFTLTMEIL